MPLQVFVRERPHTTADGRAAVTPVVDPSSSSRTIQLQTRTGKFQTAGPFSAVFNPTHRNNDVFSTAVQPMVRAVSNGRSSVVLCYGHSGSGKTHTMIGYDSSDVGVCSAAIRELFGMIPTLVSGPRHVGRDRTTTTSTAAEVATAPEPVVAMEDIVVVLRAAEVYGERVFDLLSKREECTLREDSEGTVHIRREPTVDPKTGAVTMRPQAARTCRTIAEAEAALATALASRRTGHSSLHAQSSRSHAVLELSFATRAQSAAIDAATVASSLVIPCGKRMIDVTMMMQRDRYAQDDTGRWYDTGAAPNPELQAEADALAPKLAELEAAEAAAWAAADAATPAFAKGSVTFVDLAGAEYGGAGPQVVMSQSAEERKEARLINSSLLAVNNVVRALYPAAPAPAAARGARAATTQSGATTSAAGSKTVATAEPKAKQTTTAVAVGSGNGRTKAKRSQRVPYRGGKISMVLRKAFETDAGCDSAILCTVCGNVDQAHFTKATLQYAAMMVSGQ